LGGFSIWRFLGSIWTSPTPQTQKGRYGVSRIAGFEAEEWTSFWSIFISYGVLHCSRWQEAKFSNNQIFIFYNLLLLFSYAVFLFEVSNYFIKSICLVVEQHNHTKKNHFLLLGTFH
jgi:hypothetical protein